MKMLLRIAAQTLNYQRYASSGLQKNYKKMSIWDFECLFRKFNLSSDWFMNFECRFANFQRPTLLRATKGKYRNVLKNLSVKMFQIQKSVSGLQHQKTLKLCFENSPQLME